MAQLHIERLPGPGQPDSPTPPAIPWYRSRRLQVFAVVSGIVLTVGLLIVFLRPPIYEASASLLTTPLPDADQTETIVDPQHVAIQRVLLTGQPLLVETLNRLEWQGLVPEGVTPADLKAMLSVEPVPDTNLVKLRAEGADRDLLAPLVNTWIDVYMETRAREIQATTGATLDALRRQLATLEGKIIAKREALDRFRRQYDIASLERSENAVLARLKGLTKSLNEASEAEVNAKARLDSIREAIERGKPVVPDEDKRVLAVLEERAQALRERLTELEQRFTPDYIRLNPAYSKVPRQLREVEAKIAALVGRGRRIVLAQAEQDYASARQAVLEIKRQLQEHKKLATEFSNRFAEHEALVKELEQMEETQRELQDRITRLEVKQMEKYPQVEVVERAYRPQYPIRPHYWRDAGLVALGALGTGLLAVWLLEYLTHRERGLPETKLTLAGVHVYAQPESQPLFGHAKPASDSLEQPASPVAELESPPPRELTIDEMNRLLSHADLRTRQTIALLISGLTPDEVTRINATDFDFNQDLLFAPSPNRRILPLAPRLKTWLAASGNTPLVPNREQELGKLLYITAVEAEIEDPESVTPAALRHTYLRFLVRQGLKLTQLESIAGPLSLEELALYRRLSPPEADLSADQVDKIHPCLRF